MTRKYLDLSRIEKGELKVNLREVEVIHEVILPLLEDFEDTLTAKKVTLINEMPATLTLSVDRDLLQVVFRNLIDNALKYGRPGGIIKLMADNRGTQWSFEIWNQGDNLPNEQLAQIFDKFVRLRRKEGLVQGTGLGLFITREIIRKHGGEIRARCQGDNWIKFCFTLPRIFSTPQ